LRAEDDVAELAWNACREDAAAVDWKGENVGRLVAAEMVALERPDLVGRDEGDAEVALGNSLLAENAARERTRTLLVDCHAASVLELDPDHLRR